MHTVLDGENWRLAIGRHRGTPDDCFIRKTLEGYAAAGFDFLRDGGDRWGVALRAKTLAPEYGITYRAPLAPFYQKGCYGSFIGLGYENLGQYKLLVEQARKQGADFVKIMVSGIMDFREFGLLSEPGRAKAQIFELCHIAREEGFSVMAHANGGDTALWAAEAGAASVEHGAYLHREALAAMKELGTVWVPTLSAVGNLLGKGRYGDGVLEKILYHTGENLEAFSQMGGLIACGSDAGAWAVPHSADTEIALLCRFGITPEAVQKGNGKIKELF